MMAIVYIISFIWATTLIFSNYKNLNNAGDSLIICIA